MAKNIDKTFNSLVKIQDSLITALEQLEDFKDDLEGYNGEIKRVLPMHVDTLISQLGDIVDGPDQHSLDNLIKFLDQIPIGEVRTKKRDRRGSGSEDEEDIDLSPDLSEGSRSAILSENEKIVRKYMREELKSSSPKKSKEVDTDWSFSKIREQVNKEDDAEYDPSTGRVSSNASPYLKERFSEETKYRPGSGFSFNAIKKDPLLRESIEEGDFGGILGQSEVGSRAPSMMRESAYPEMKEGDASLSDWKNISRETSGPNDNDLLGMMKKG